MDSLHAGFRFCSVLVAAGLIWCQAQTARPMVRGQVLDPARAPIAGARVTATSGAGAVNASTLSDPSGEFSLALEPGTYTLTILAEGFQADSRALSVQQAGRETMEVLLQVAAPHDVVTVTAADYLASTTGSATKTLTPLVDTPQSITVVAQEQIRDQQLLSIGDVLRYVPGVTAHQGENNRDQVVISGNSYSANFFLNGVRDDVQYYRDLYNVERVEALKGPNSMLFGRGGGGGVIN